VAVLMNGSTVTVQVQDIHYHVVHDRRAGISGTTMAAPGRHIGYRVPAQSQHGTSFVGHNGGAEQRHHST
jgi:hypothetical protein